jgi:hypothetical protein
VKREERRLEKGALASVASESGRNRIMIYGPKNDGILLNEKHYASPSHRTHTRNSIRRNGCHIGV